jgi:hypothetical protein
MHGRYRRINRNVRDLVDRHLHSCVPGTRIDAKDLAHQFSDRDRVYLVGTISHILQGHRGLRCTSIAEYVVI